MNGRWDEIRRLLHTAGFSGDLPSLEDLYHHNDAFHELCQHYLDCYQAFSNWSVSKAPKAEERRQEYADVLQELEVEILEFPKRTEKS